MTALIFDLDGTLWDSTEGVVEAWNSVLASEGYGSDWMTAKKLHGVMGKTITQIGREFFPELNTFEQLALVERCCAQERTILKDRGSVLYSGLVHALEALSKQYELFIVSNCQEDYIETFLDHHRLGGYFKDFESHGRTGLTKGENIRLVMTRNQIEEAIYMGDTQGDFDAAEQAGVPFIYAAYGFGNLAEMQPPWAIQEIEELPVVVNSIIKHFNFLCKC